MGRNPRIAFASFLLLELCACSAVVDLGDKRRTEEMHVQLAGFAPFADACYELRLVNTDTGLAEARAVLDGTKPDSEESVPVRIVSAMDPDADYIVQVHVDEFGDAGCDGTFDHVYEAGPADGPERFFVVDLGAPVASVEPPGALGGDFIMDFHQMNPHPDQQLELMLIDEDTGRGVGYYYTSGIEDESDDPDNLEFQIRIPGVIQADHFYTVEFYADRDDNSWYTPPNSDGEFVDHSWIRGYGASGSGLTADFVHSLPFDELTVF
jgi:hypothetical protein